MPQALQHSRPALAARQTHVEVVPQLAHICDIEATQPTHHSAGCRHGLEGKRPPGVHVARQAFTSQVYRVRLSAGGEP